MIEAARADRIHASLRSYKADVEAAMARYLPEREPWAHLYSLVRDYPGRGGKGLRPALCMAACGAVGGSPAQAARSAAAVEMFHNGFLIHDDIEDGSLLRRGLPTLHAAHGIPLALNAGDAMFVLSMRPLMENLPDIGPGLTWLVLAEVEHMVRESVEGQAIELGWVHDNPEHLEDEDYFRMCLKKTCWYTTMHPLRIGALIGAGGSVAPDSLNSFGYFLGLAFQIQDDLLNLVGELHRYGKEIGGDVLEGKRTLALIHLQRSLPEPRRQDLTRFLAKPREARDQAEMALILAEMQRLGSIDHARQVARFLAGAALAEFARVFGEKPTCPHRRFLRDLIIFMIERDL
jgi:geranylgeranyl diphosphate synthase, type II